jgi:hypothetical protein
MNIATIEQLDGCSNCTELVHAQYFNNEAVLKSRAGFERQHNQQDSR